MQANFPEDLVIIGFPCNQFGMQEPGADGQEIMNGLKHVRPGQGFEPNFVMLAKGEVNGRTEHPLYTFLKSSCLPTRDFFVPNRKLYYEPIRNTDVRWNFEKFLIDKQGRPVVRYDPGSNVTHIASDVKYLLEQN